MDRGGCSKGDEVPWEAELPNAGSWPVITRREALGRLLAKEKLPRPGSTGSWKGLGSNGLAGILMFIFGYVRGSPHYSTSQQGSRQRAESHMFHGETVYN